MKVLGKENVNLLYIIPQRRPYKPPAKRTLLEQKVHEAVNHIDNGCGFLANGACQ